MEDTDSKAIVATQRGGVIPCQSDPGRDKTRKEIIRALSWKQVAKITEKFATLNPYDRRAVRGSILKIEKDNFDPMERVS